MLGLGLSTTTPAVHRRAGAISVLAPPSLGQLFDDEPPASRYTQGSYTSMAGAITSLVATCYVDGVEGDINAAHPAGSVIHIKETVADAVGNSLVSPTAQVTVLVTPDAPDAFGSSDWSLADNPSTNGDTLTITLLALPADGASVITDLQYSVNGGAWTSLGGLTVGDYDITVPALAACTVQVRAVNAIGPSPASDTKTATPTSTAPVATAPAMFGASDWSLVDAPSASGDELTLTILALPSNGGSAITALQYQEDGGAWTALTGTGTGARTITTSPAETAASIKVRAVNAVGNGAASAAKVATPSVTVVGDIPVSFGARTLNGAGGEPLPSGAASISNAGGTNLVVASGLVVPASNGLGVSSGTVTFNTGVTWAVTAVADDYSVLNATQFNAALNDIGTADNRSITMRYNAGTTYGPLTISNKTPITRLTIQAADASNKPVVKQVTLNNVSQVTFDGIDFYQTSNAKCVITSGTNILANNKFVRCRFRATDTPVDTHGDYSASRPVGDSTAGFGLTSTRFRHLEVSDCVFQDINEGFKVTNNTGFFLFARNWFRRIHEDGIHFNGGLNSVHIHSNIFQQSTSKGGDQGNPHTDYIQAVAGSASRDTDPICIEGNIIFIGDSRGHAQGIFLDDIVNNWRYTVKIRGNIVCNNGSSHGINIARTADGSEVDHNTVVHDTPGVGGVVWLRAAGGGGSISVQNNIAEQVSTGGTATFDTTGNVALGLDGSTIAYAAAFDGPTWSPQTVDEVLTKYDPTATYAAKGAKAIATFDMTQTGTDTISIGNTTFATEVLPPQIADQGAAATGDTTAKAWAAVNKANATLYWAATASAAAPTAAAIIAGTGALASGSLAPDGNGRQVASVTGLPAGTTSYVHFVLRDTDANDSSVLTASVTTTGVPASAPPVNTVPPVISGTATEGQTLSSTTGSWNNSPSSYTYQWKADAVAIVGATSSTYTLQAAEIGADITCTVTATNAQGSASATSNSLGPVAAASGVPVNTVAPVVSGTPTEGQTLSTDDGTWTNSPTGYTYRWLRSSVAISGATSSTYTLQAADVGETIQSEVTASNGSGSSSPALSSAVGPVAAAGSGITVVGYKFDEQAGTSSSRSINLSGFTAPGGAEAGAHQDDDVLVLLRGMATGAFTNPGDSSSMTLLEQPWGNDDDDVIADGRFKKLLASDSAVTITTGTANSLHPESICLLILRGVDPTTQLDVAVVFGSAANGTLVDPGSITPVTDGALIVTLGAASYGDVSASSPYTFTPPASTYDTFLTPPGGGEKTSARGVSVGVGIRTWNTGDGAFDSAAWSLGINPAGGARAYVVAAFRPAP